MVLVGLTVVVVLAVLFAAAAVVAAIVAVRARSDAATLHAALTEARRNADRESTDHAAAIERLEAVIATVGDGVVVCGSDGRVVLRNPAAVALLDDAVGGSLVSSAVARAIEAARTSGDGSAAEEAVDLFGPPRRSLVVTASLLRSASGKAIGVVCLLDDVSERRHVDAVRRDFVANMSHELKTPVGALGLLAETLLDETDPSVSRRLAERMQDEAIRVNRIIEDLLDLSRIESQEAPSRDPIPIGAVIAEATDRLRPAAEHRGIALEVAAAAPGTSVIGDHRQLVSAVHSLVENAIAYTEPGGRVDVGAVRDGASVRVTVADSGVGIPARDLDRIFERFYRVDRARARATGGTGLGLSIVRHVAQNHGGTVHVQSQEGVGSTFTLELPAGPMYLIRTDVTRPEEATG